MIKCYVNTTNNDEQECNVELGDCEVAELICELAAINATVLTQLQEHMKNDDGTIIDTERIMSAISNMVVDALREEQSDNA